MYKQEQAIPQKYQKCQASAFSNLDEAEVPLLSVLKDSEKEALEIESQVSRIQEMLFCPDFITPKESVPTPPVRSAIDLARSTIAILGSISLVLNRVEQQIEGRS